MVGRKAKRYLLTWGGQKLKKTMSVSFLHQKKTQNKNLIEKKKPKMDKQNLPSINASQHLSLPTLKDALSRALDLEVEGRHLYLDCSRRTANAEGKALFNFLANEEKVHYEKVARYFESVDFEGYCSYVEAKNLVSGVFEKSVLGGKLDKRSDALDALNIGIKAEENSIELYQNLAKESKKNEISIFFSKLVGEENRHLIILKTEAEFVLETGEFHDFKVVTM
jgi:rubrerythrin